VGVPIDLAGARAAFEDSVDGSVGLEEEFALCDPETLALVPRFEELRERPALADTISGELIRSEVEIRSGRGVDAADAIARQRDARRRLFATAAELGIALGATGTHAFSDYREQQFIETEHYRRVADGLQWVARRNNTFSMHVHVGVQGPDRAIAACDRLRGVLPTLLALSASSPFYDGVDSGLHSARTQMFTKSFPRCGVPDHYGDWAAYHEYVDLLVRLGSIEEYTQVWWSVRPHFTFGTVEVRIADAQPSAPEAEALAALMVACVLQAVADHDAGVPFVPPSRRMVEENVWRAVRHGMDGRLIDLDALREVDARAAVDGLLAWTGPAREAYGIAEPVFPARNSAQRQRALIAEGAAPAEVYAATVAETKTTYASAHERSAV